MNSQENTYLVIHDNTFKLYLVESPKFKYHMTIVFNVN